MALNKETIINNSKKVYACMYQMVHYTFNELQKICQLGNTELCLALVQLMQENKIKQDRNEQGIYYATNRYLKPKDYLSLSLGVKLQFL